MHRNLKIRLSSFARDARGVAYIEFAITITLLLLLLWGGVELSRYLLILQKIEKTVSVVGNVTSSANPVNSPLTNDELSQMMATVPDMVYPYLAGANIKVIITDVSQAGNTPTINWQYCGGGTLAANSKIGSGTGTANLGSFGNFSMTPGEEVIIGEVFYSYSPILQQSVINAMPLYRSAIYMTRYGSLASSITSNCP